MTNGIGSRLSSPAAAWKMRTPLSILLMLLVSMSPCQGEMPHSRPCDVAQEKPGDLNPGGGNAVMFGLCSGVQDAPTGDAVSRVQSWNAYNCGYQAYRQGKYLVQIRTKTTNWRSGGVQAGRMHEQHAAREGAHFEGRSYDPAKTADEVTHCLRITAKVLAANCFSG